MEFSMCKICKDPNWGFICTDCLADDIKKWLPKRTVASFTEFHNSLSSHFRFNTDNFEHCIHCKTKTDASVCAYCYINETYFWLKERHPRLAEKLKKMLPLAHDWKMTKMNGCAWKTGYSELKEAKAMDRQFGICDECGEYSNDLVLANGELVCTECSDKE